MAEPLVCSVTYMRVRNLRVLPAFLWHAWRVTRVARRSPGHVSHRLLGLPPLPFFFTVSVWESEAALAPFLAAPDHRAAMSHFEEFARVAKFARFRSERRRVSWRRALAQLKHADAVWTPDGARRKAV
jgi:heme-degrading monooxygenase HmoA